MTEKRVERSRLERITETTECTAGERAAMAREVLAMRVLCADAARAIIAGILSGRPNGCCWHMVIDDGNVEDENVEHCATNANQKHVDCVTLGPLLTLLTEDDRERLLEGEPLQG